jgi:hypothetical protein
MSAAPNIDRGPERPMMPATSPTRIHWTRRKSLVVASCLTATVVAAVALRAASDHPPRAWVGRSTVASAPGLASDARAESPAIAQARSESSVPVKSAAPAASAAFVVPATVTKELAELKSAYERLTVRAQDTDQRLDRVESDVTQLKQQFEKQQAALARATKRSRNAPARPRTAQATVQLQRPSVPLTVLGVDTWNGQPSVSVQAGAEVRFFSEGDVVADALIKRADAGSQRVEFVYGSGASVTTTSAAGEAR